MMMAPSVAQNSPLNRPRKTAAKIKNHWTPYFVLQYTAAPNRGSPQVPSASVYLTPRRVTIGPPNMQTIPMSPKLIAVAALATYGFSWPAPPSP